MTQELSKLPDKELWGTMAEASDAMCGLAKLYIALEQPTSREAREQLRAHLGVLDKLRDRFDQYFYELELRYSDDEPETDAEPHAHGEPDTRLAEQAGS